MITKQSYTGNGAEYGAQARGRPTAAGPAYDRREDAWNGLDSLVDASAAHASASAAPANVDDDAVTLHRSYRAHGEDVRVVRIRRPTGRDVSQCGYPFRIVQSQGGTDLEYKIVGEAVSKLIVALSSPPLPRSTVDSLDIRDWNLLSQKLNSFFLE